MIPFYREIKLGLILLAVFCVGMAVLTMCVKGNANQKRDLEIAERTGEALDKASKKTDEIRQEQKAKENDVSKIEGSDARLPDGFGAGLEQLRKR